MPAETLTGLKVLLVEDEIATRSALGRVIGDAGVEVVAPRTPPYCERLSLGAPAVAALC